MKNEEKKNEDFFYLVKIFHFLFTETLNLADFKYIFRFLISFFDQKLSRLKMVKKGQKWVKWTHFGGL